MRSDAALTAASIVIALSATMIVMWSLVHLRPAWAAYNLAIALVALSVAVAVRARARA